MICGHKVFQGFLLLLLRGNLGCEQTSVFFTRLLGLGVSFLTYGVELNFEKR